MQSLRHGSDAQVLQLCNTCAYESHRTRKKLLQAKPDNRSNLWRKKVTGYQDIPAVKFFGSREFQLYLDGNSCLGHVQIDEPGRSAPRNDSWGEQNTAAGTPGRSGRYRGPPAQLASEEMLRRRRSANPRETATGKPSSDLSFD